MTTREGSGFSGFCKAIIHPRTGKRIGRPYPCIRTAVRDGFCTQHHKVAYGKRLVSPAKAAQSESDGLDT